MPAYDNSAANSGLLANIRRRAFAPTAQAAGGLDADLLAIADDEVRDFLAPLMMKVREDHLVTHTDQQLVTSQAAYRIPGRAIGNKTREVQTVTPSGIVSKLNKIAIENTASLDPTPGTPNRFYSEGAYVTILPAPASSVGGTGNVLRLYIETRPSRLTISSAASQITAINTAAKQLTVSSAPATFLSTALFDLVRNDSPFEWLGVDLPISSIVGNVLTFVGALPVAPFAPVVGDWVTLAQESPIPNLPLELHGFLAQRAANAWMRQSGGYSERVQAGEAAAKEIFAEAMGLLTPRHEGEVDVLINDAFYPPFYSPGF